MRLKTFSFSALAAALLTLAAATPAFAADTTTPQAPNAKAFAAYQSCMKKHGVKIDTNRGPAGGGPGAFGANGGPAAGGASGPGPGGPGAGGAAAPDPNGGAGGNGPGANGAGGSGNFVPRNLPKGVAAKKYQAAQKACAGKLPKGGFGGIGGQGSQQFQAYLGCLSDHGVKVPKNGGLQGLDRSTPAFQAANETCGVLLPSSGGGQGGAPGAGPGGATATTAATAA